jgi:pseudaminic acid cytidylyltransferase
MNPNSAQPGGALTTTDGGTLAVIPARGGSKRIPRKNIRPFHGVPMLARTIALLRAAEVFDRIVVSTDDDEIIEVAKSAGAEVPFRRPAELSNDTAATVPVIQHAVRALAEREFSPEYVCCVYPAAVLTTRADLHEGLSRLKSASSFDFAFTATSYAYPLQRALREPPGGGCEMMWPEQAQSRSQDLEPAYHDAGQFYWGHRAAWLEGRPLFSQNSSMILLPRHRVQDIDTYEDWERAELIFELLQRGV